MRTDVTTYGLFFKARNLLLAVVFALSFSEAYSLTLDSALLSAYHNNPRFKITRIERQREREISFKGLPTFLPVAAVASSKDKKLAAFVWRFSMENLTKFAGASAKKRSELYKSMEEERKLIQEGVECYLDLYQAQRALQSTKAKLELAKRYEALVRSKFVMKDSTKAQLAIAEAGVLNAQLQHEKGMANLQNKECEFRRFFCINNPVLDLKPTDKSLLVPENLEKVFKLGSEASYVLQQKENALRAAKKVYATSALTLVPGIKIKASRVLWEKGKKVEPEFGLSASISLVGVADNFFETRAKKCDLRKAALELQSSRSELDSKLLQSWNSYMISKLDCSAAQKGLEACELALLAAQREQSMGKGSLIDLCQAQQKLEEAKIAAIDAKVKSNKAAYNLLSLCGLHSLRN